MAKPKPVPPNLRAQLMGTTVERGQPAAMFRIPSGRFATLKVGDTFENEPGTVRIVSIEGKAVTMQFEGFEETITLNVR